MSMARLLGRGWVVGEVDGRIGEVVPMLDGLLLPAPFGTNSNRVLAVMAHEGGPRFGHVDEVPREQIVGVEGLGDPERLRARHVLTFRPDTSHTGRCRRGGGGRS